MLKDHLVCNVTLAQIADRYGIPDRIIAAPSSALATKSQTKTKGSMFESYVGAVFYSFIGEDPFEGSFGGAAKCPGNENPSREGYCVCQAHGDGQAASSKAQDDPYRGQEVNSQMGLQVATLYPAIQQPAAAIDDDNRHTLQSIANVDIPSDQTDHAPDAPSSHASEAELGSAHQSRGVRTKQEPPSPLRPKNPLVHEGLSSTSDTGDLQSLSTAPSVPNPRSPDSQIEPFKATLLTSQIETMASDDGTHVSCVSCQTKVVRKSRGDGYVHLARWLRPLLTPIAEFALECMREEVKRLEGISPDVRLNRMIPPEWLEEDAKAVGSTGYLNIMAQKEMAGMPKYEDGEYLGEGLWTIVCTVYGTDGQRW